MQNRPLELISGRSSFLKLTRKNAVLTAFDFKPSPFLFIGEDCQAERPNLLILTHTPTSNSEGQNQREWGYRRNVCGVAAWPLAGWFPGERQVAGSLALPNGFWLFLKRYRVKP